MNSVRKTKMEIKPNVLCKDMDPAIYQMLSHSRSISFNQQPDYKLLRSHLVEGLARLNKK